MLSREEKLVLLVEECGEVIQAATKCLRFGFSRDWPGYGVNHEVLAREVGDLLGIVDSLELDRSCIGVARASKMHRAEHWKRHVSSFPSE